MASTVKRLLLFALCLGLPFFVGYICPPPSSSNQFAFSYWGQHWTAPLLLWTESIWQGLYILMGLSIYLVLQSKGDKRQKTFAAAIYVGQLAVLGVWGGLCFVVSAWASCAGILLLDAVAGVCMFSFKEISSNAAIFFTPYLIWLSIITCLSIVSAVAG